MVHSGPHLAIQGDMVEICEETGTTLLQDGGRGEKINRVSYIVLCCVVYQMTD